MIEPHILEARRVRHLLSGAGRRVFHPDVCLGAAFGAGIAPC